MAELQKVSRVSMAGQVVNSVRDAIQGGAYQVGDRLPNETELARQLGVGRSSVREGMRILAGYGLVEIRQGEGTFVADRQARQLFSLMGYQSDEESMGHLCQLRHVFETGCVGIVCDRGLSREQYQELSALVEQLRAADDVPSAVAADGAFHQKLFLYTQNPLLIQIYGMIAKLMDSLMAQLMSQEDVLRDARESHGEILDALRGGDRERSVAAMTKHLNTVDDYVHSYLPGDR